MKYLKTYEQCTDKEKLIYDDCRYCEPSERERMLNNVAHYFEDNIGITNKEGFSECLYDNAEDIPTEYCFYFQWWTEEENYEKFYKFLEDNGLEVSSEPSYGFDVIVSEDKIKEFAELYKIQQDAKKYNL